MCCYMARVGVHTLVPSELLTLWDEGELELLLCGLRSYNLATLKQNYVLVGARTPRYLSVCLSVYLSLFLSVSLSLCLSVSLSLCLSVSLSLLNSLSVYKWIGSCVIFKSPYG